MDLEGRSLSVRLAEAVSVSPSGSSVPQASFHSGANTSFPILVVAILGILATIFLLVSYYVFVIKCCLNWHRIDLLSRFSLSRRHRGNDQFLLHTPEEEPRGLDEAIIRSIPIFRYKNKGKQSRDLDQRSYCECAVCLNEFQEEEKLRIIPDCSHVFHIDCIDIWLQNNANCPLCRTSVSARPTAASAFDLEAQIVTPSPPPQDPIIHSDEDYVVIELGGPSSNPTISGEDSPPKKPDTRTPKKGRKLPKGSSMGDESINTRGLRLLCHDDDRCSGPVQPIRRSISMDSAADRQLLLAVQEIVQQTRKERELQSLSSLSFSPIERSCSSSSSSTVRRTFFSFGHGRASRSAVQPVCMET